MKGLCFLVLVGTMMFSACGGGYSSSVSQIPLTLSGNWQFTLAPPADGSFSGGLQGGFLLQKSTAVTGAAAYSIALPASPTPTVCNSGSAAITGTLTGQEVALVAVAGTQTFTFTGTLSLNGSTMGGTYTSTAGTAANGTGCGTAQTGLQWNAIPVPTLTGSVQGTFHSAGGAAGLNEQDFLLSGALTQAANTGADNAAVTGNLNFLNATTNLSDYPCFGLVSVKGQISGNTVILQILGTDGSTLGQIGGPTGSPTGLSPVTLNSAPGGYFLQGVGPTYLVATTAGPCVGNLGNTTTAGDFGNICLALNGASACQQPVTLAPSALTFPAGALGSPSTQTITLTNTSGTTLNGVTLALTNNSAPGNFTETDACGIEGAPSGGKPFSLITQQSCAITVTFIPQESCAPSVTQCLTATLTASSPTIDSIFILAVPITGTGVSAMADSTAKLDFDAKGFSAASLFQWLSSNSHNAHTAQTLPGSSTRTFQNVEHDADID